MIALDVLLLIVISVCIVYCFMLNARIQSLEARKGEFSQMIKQFDAATAKANSSLEEISKTSSKINKELLSNIDKAQEINSDLNIMQELGSSIACKLENTIAKQNEGKRTDQKEPQLQEHKDELLKTNNYYETLKRIK